jgi:MFS family permease
VTPLGRLVPAIVLSNTGFMVAVSTPLQLLLALHLTALVGADGATGAVGIVTGAGALVAMVLNPVAGRISDRTRWRLGRRRTWVLAGAGAGALTLVAISATTQVWQVVLLWCLVQACFNFQYAATVAVVPDQVPEHRRGMVSGFAGVTAAAGPLIGIAIVNLAPATSARQWHYLAVAALVAAVVAAVLLRDPVPAGPGALPAERRGGLAGLVRTFWIDPRRHPAFGWAWLVRFLVTCAYASSSYNTFFLMDRFGISTQDVGGAVLGLSMVSIGTLVVSSLGAGVLSDAIRRQKPFVIAAGVVAAVGLLLQAFATALPVVYVATALLGLACGSFFAVDLALCVRVLPSSADAGRDLAIINIANSLPQSLVPFVAPALLALGGYTALYCVLALLGVLGAVAVLRVPEIGQEHGGSPRVAPVTRPPAP